jgi:hypothetical protein
MTRPSGSKSWYVLFFQVPALPEALARATNYAFVRPVLGRDQAEPPRDWVPNVRLVRLPGISQRVQNDAAEHVNSLLVEFLS